MSSANANPPNAGAPSGTPPGDTIVRKKSRKGPIIAVVVIVIIVIVLGGAYAAGWLTPKTSKQSLTGAGSTFVFPLMSQWESSYTTANVNYQSVGSGAGIQQITAKTVDFGATDAPLSGTQKAAAPGILQFPESAGAVAIIYNIPGVTATVQFTGPVLAAIYLGKITHWNDPAIQSIQASGVTLPSQPIAVVHRSDGSGTSFVFTSYLSAENTSWASQVGHGTSVNWPVGTGAKGSSAVTSTVQTTMGGIGYVDLEYALVNHVTYGTVENPSSAFITPTIASAASAIADTKSTFPNGAGDWSNVTILNSPGAGDYPITTLTYLVFYQDPGVAFGSSYSHDKAAALFAFLAWTLTTGQTYSQALYYVPLPLNIVAIDTATLATMTFNGGAI
ncbi:MAG: phosphate ABC transporter substrate-binding protein PstS [Thermoplasmata archaeon]|nr:phosphate ABC transporter substrate-binding protein PstS [Thermoplasmata archaeon]